MIPYRTRAMLGNDKTYNDQPSYYPPELVHHPSSDDDGHRTIYHCYVIGLVQHFTYDVTVHDMVLALRIKLDDDIARASFDVEDSRGVVSVNLRYVGMIRLSRDQVLLCRKFQAAVLHVLLNHTIPQLNDFDCGNSCNVDYLILPSGPDIEGKKIKDWRAVISVLFTDLTIVDKHIGYKFSKDHFDVMTKDGLKCSCMLENSLVFTPHNSRLYCITGFYDNLSANSPLVKRNGKITTYKEYYNERHGIKLNDMQQPFLKGRHIFYVQNCLQSRQQQKGRDPSNSTVELPPELCSIIMSPIQTGTLYSFSFVPSIMHRLEALLIAANLKRMHLDYQMHDIPSSKLLEAITTKHCQEKFHLESLETLGDSFLKYAVSQQLFKNHQDYQEGQLHAKKEEIISNMTLCQLGCDRKLPGFIHNEKFDPKKWIIPGGKTTCLPSCEELLPVAKKMYVFRRQELKNRTVADVVEALLGVYVSMGGDIAGLRFMNWLGLKIDFVSKPYRRNFPVNPKEHLDVKHIESLLNYSFRDPSLLVEALTHGSYTLPESYQRLEFLGDSVLDYLITIHLYKKYPGMSPGVLTDLRSASVNNDCYARSAVKAGLHKHILHNSSPLDNFIIETINNFDKLSSEPMFGWESETSFPKVLGDIIESLAGAILVDSGYKKKIVFKSIIPLLEPLVTPQTVKLHPVRELTELCQVEHYTMTGPSVSYRDGIASITVEVEARGRKYKCTSEAANKKTAKKLAAKEMLKELEELKAGSSSRM